MIDIIRKVEGFKTKYKVGWFLFSEIDELLETEFSEISKSKLRSRLNQFDFMELDDESTVVSPYSIIMALDYLTPPIQSDDTFEVEESEKHITNLEEVKVVLNYYKYRLANGGRYEEASVLKIQTIKLDKAKDYLHSK